MGARAKGPAPLERPGLLFHLDSIRLTEYDDDGFLGIQIDADGDSVEGAPELEAQVAPFEALHAYGFNGRPQDPTVDDGGQVNGGALSLTIWEGSRGYSVALHDSRVVPALARIKPGESVQYACANNFIRCHDDGRISQMCTTDGTEDGQVIAQEQGPNGWAWRGPWGKLTHDGLGFHYLHSSGARIDGGAISGLPAPLNSFGSYWTIQAAIISLKGAAVMVGSGTYDPAAKATPTLAVLSAEQTSLAALSNAVTALATAVSALAGIPANSAASAAAGLAAAAAQAAASAVGASGTAVGNAATTLPARSVQVA